MIHDVKYVVITPVRDEERHGEATVRSVASQTKRGTCSRRPGGPRWGVWGCRAGCCGVLVGRLGGVPGVAVVFPPERGGVGVLCGQADARGFAWLVVWEGAAGAAGQPVGGGSACRRLNAAASCPAHGQSRDSRRIVLRAWRAIRPDWCSRRYRSRLSSHARVWSVRHSCLVHATMSCASITSHSHAWLCSKSLNGRLRIPQSLPWRM